MSSRKIGLGWAAVLTVILFWGVTFVNTRALLVEFSALEIQLLRYTMAWATLALISGRCRWAGKDERLFALMGFTGAFVYQFMENCAIYYTNASNVAILVSFGPVVTAIMARIFTREHSLSPKLILGSLVAMVGVAIVSLNGVVNFHMRPLGDLMALGGIVVWGWYSILIDKVNAKGYPAIVAIRKTFFWAVVWIIPVAIWGATDSGYVVLDGSYSVTLDKAANIERFSSLLNWTNLAFLGLFASAMCFVMWNFSCKVLGVVRTTICLYLTPVVGVAFAAAFIGERLTAMSTIGGAIIVVGVVLATWRKIK